MLPHSSEDDALARHASSSTVEAIDWRDLHRLCESAVINAGGDSRIAATLADATIAAERRGKPSVGVSHLHDYLAALREGRLNGSPRVSVAAPRRSIVSVSADDGPAQFAYTVARQQLIDAARDCGVAMMGIRRCFTAGELGSYVGDLAAHGLFAVAGANSPPLMSLFAADRPVTGTNPLAYGVPSAGDPRVVDQAASAVAWVRVREAADRGDSIPPGWAIDQTGTPTTDPAAAVAGALLPTGGVKGSNIAVLIEIMAALVGGRFSLDVPPLDAGTEPLRVGFWVIAIDPVAIDPAFIERSDTHFERLHPLIGHDFGRRRAPLDKITVPKALLAGLRD